MTDRD